jgi:hypothetical protein
MGNCAYENPKAYTAEELADLGIGQTQQVYGTCTTAGQSEQRWCPNNGEFVSDDSSACAFNTTNNDGRSFYCGDKDDSWIGCGGGSWTGQCEIVGSSTKCERRSFSADPTDCCKADGKKIINGKTCDPQYRDASSAKCRDANRNYCKTITSNPDHDPACKSFMAASNKNDTDVRNAYCSRGDTLFTDEMCSSWVTDPKPTNETVIDTLMRNKCTGNNVSKNPCKSYVINRSTKDSSYDNIMTKFCSQNPELSLCRCIMSDHNTNTDGSLKGRPECIDANCAGLKGGESPFKTFDMNQNSDNCSYVNCQQWVDFGTTIGVDNVSNSQMEMNCGSPGGSVKKTQTVSGNDLPKTKKGMDNQTKGMDNKTKGIIGLLLFVVVLFFLFVGLPWIQGPSQEDWELNDLGYLPEQQYEDEYLPEQQYEDEYLPEQQYEDEYLPEQQYEDEYLPEQ